MFRKSVEIIQVSYNLAIIKGTLHGELSIFMIASLSFLLRMRSVSEEAVKEVETYIYFSIYIFTNPNRL
jgi:hypothetical protein